MAQEWIVFFVVVSVIVICCWRLKRNGKTQEQPTHVDDEHYQLGWEHALAGKKPSLETEAYQDGYSDGRKALKKKN
ncbi:MULTISPECIES: hypothetical protein [Aeromonas]|uniref:hypothetical protein n=1 Tax=Aeromonas TaxID=642 RepID=UPI002B0618C8|nr:hypothetical protein [Aeromonas jandaei]